MAFIGDPKVSTSYCIDSARTKVVYGVSCYLRNGFAICICSDSYKDGSVSLKLQQAKDEGANVISVCNNGTTMMQGGDKGDNVISIVAQQQFEVEMKATRYVFAIMA